MSELLFHPAMRWEFYHHAGQYAEVFRFGWPSLQVPDNAELVGVWDPGVISSERVNRLLTKRLPPEWSEDRVTHYFDGNLAAQSDMFVRMAGQSVRQMPDPQFWGLVELLGGVVRRSGIGALRRALKEMDDDDVIGFAKAWDAVSHRLDSPALAIRSRFRGMNVLSEDATMAMRVRIIAAGRAAVEDAIRSPDAAVSAFRSGKLSGESLQWLAGSVLAERYGKSTVFIDTGIDARVGGNRENWPEDPLPPRPVPRTRTWADWLAEQQLKLDGTRSSLSSIDPRRAWGDEWWRAEEIRDWRSVRYVIHMDDGYEERLDLIAFRMPHEQRDQPAHVRYLDDFTQRSQAFAEHQAQDAHGTLVAYEALAANPISSAFTITRRSRANCDDYRAQYRIGEQYLEPARVS